MKTLIVSFLLLVAYAAHAATWYAAADGSNTNGTRELPWSVKYSVTNTAYLRPGDTVLFKPGTYVCTDTNAIFGNAPILELLVSGTPSAKITYRPESLWGFSFDGGLWLYSVTNLIIRDFRVFYSGSTNRNRMVASTHPPGISEFLPGNEILHNLFDNTGHSGIASWGNTLGKYIAGNIIRFSGQQDFTESYAGGARGSGMYLQNAADSSEALIQGNISYYNYTTAMKAYGSASVWGFNFTKNITFNNEEGIFTHRDTLGSRGIIIKDNDLWESGQGLHIGYQLGDGGHSNAVVYGNYSVSTNLGLPIAIIDGWSYCTITNNVFVQTFRRGVFALELVGETSGNTASHFMSDNQYYAGPISGYGPLSFSIKDVFKTFDEWKGETLTDSNSTLTYGMPTQLVARVFAPSYDSNFVHVSVFNWQTNAATTIDLKPYFRAGDRLKVFDAQNAPTAYRTITYFGDPLSLNLTLTNRAPMLGTFTLRTNAWNGFDPRFRAFVIYREAQAGTVAAGVTFSGGVLR